ncbi:hypothetical protein U9M48_012267 [Paspalum notatum var. saurae]|uniref:Uncharacterized protein n=1 Tax=Paspalum notatum var. saurae TaxID=547442 RepID=A0AAQ3SX91_PASNO
MSGSGVQDARDGDGDGDSDSGVVRRRRGSHEPRARRVLVFPLPFQGHINPMLHLACALHARGLAVTVLHTRFNALNPALHPEFRFVEVPDGTPAEVAAKGGIIDVILAMNAAMEASTAVRDVLASVVADDEGQPRVSCLFTDSNLLAVQKAAAAVGLPTMVLRTGSAACLGCFLAYPMLHDKGYLPPQESQLYRPVPELPPLRVKDLIFSKHCDHEMVRRVFARGTETVRNCSGVVINTFEELEPAEMQRIRDELADLPVVLAAGPLHKLSSKSSGSSLLDQDYSCIRWLDTQRPGSVLYVSFGSLASMDADEFLELAWGLADSGHPFLWVVRPKQLVGGDSDSESARLPDGFEEAVEGRGMVIRWAPQREVLAHPAVGGFWTHGGWNSTLEGISEGIPMICRPDAIDQMMDTRYVEHVWGVGFELEGELGRGKIKNAIGKLMDEREGAEMRERAKQLSTKVADCLESSGSSQIAIDKLVNYILSIMAGEGADRRARVALFPLPFQGHISPMLQLAGALHARGLAVTVLHTPFNAPDPGRHPGLDFVAVPDAVPESATGGLAKILGLNAAMAASGRVRDALASLQRAAADDDEPRLACLVLDSTLTAAQEAAAGLGLPTLVLHTGGAACFRLFRSYAMLHDKGYLPATESNLRAPVEELPPLRVSDLFDPSKLPSKEMGQRILDLATGTTTNSSGAILNTFEALEPQELETIRDELAPRGIPAFAVGPLHKLATASSSSAAGAGETTSLLSADRSCIGWLDTQAPGSVLYVSFGSVAKVTRAELAEIAWGLAGSGRPFLWVVRRGLVAEAGGEEPVELPDGFQAAAEGRGKVVEWAPQQEVLAHPAVAAFWTHSGWNSTLESVYEGVPMLSKPFFGDQLASGRYVQDAWKIGVLLEGALERGEVEKAVRRLMEEDDEGAVEIRARAKDLKEKMRMSLESTGPAPMAAAGHEQRRRRVVLFPLPFQGHITPMLQLAALLHGRGLAVTVLHTRFNAPDPRRHPELAFVPIHETLPDEATSAGDIVTQLLALNAACEAPFRDALASLLLRAAATTRTATATTTSRARWSTASATRRCARPASSASPRSCCAPTAPPRSSACSPTRASATPASSPSKASQSMDLCSWNTPAAAKSVHPATCIPAEERMDELVPGLEPLRVRDLIRVDGSDTAALCGFIARVADAVRATASGVVVNTFEAIEEPALAKIRGELSRPAFAVGPLHLLSPAAPSPLRAPDRGCLAWLDARAPRSVLYVSLGTVARVARAAFEEMAWGLAASGASFLWVVRPGLLAGGDAGGDAGDEEAPPPLPDGFAEETEGRGKVVAWAPQREVLAHRAVGAFWTHCGWNSTLEGVGEGVPMLAQPCFADQMATARYVTHEWGVGMEVGEEVERGKVAEAVAKLMAGEDGARMREKARCLQIQASSAATGSSMDSLVRYMLSLRNEDFHREERAILLDKTTSPSPMGTVGDSCTTGDRRRRVLFFPLPYQGHINPMFQLAGLLHARGFAITVFHTCFNAPDASQHPAYEFVPVPDDSGAPAADDPDTVRTTLAHIRAVNDACEAPFRERLASLLERRREEDVACLVLDAHLLTLSDVARGLGVPTLALRTGSAACFRCFMAFPELCDKGYYNYQPPQESSSSSSSQLDLDVPVTELPPYRVRDLPCASPATHGVMRELISRAVTAAKTSSGLILNTFDALEPDDLASLRRDLGVPVFAVGPLHKISPAASSSLLRQDRACLAWLDAQAPASVLYVSFGSLASMSAADVAEAAWGVAGSGRPFLWALRPGLVVGAATAPALPDGFEAATRGRGAVVSWAPQEEVLAHPAVGAFWTHCGWNSTLEGVCAGVPMLCRPCFADQMGNARYVDHVWRVGVALEGELERGKVEAAISALMAAGEPGEGLRRRARELGSRAAECVAVAGSSCASVDKLVQHILSLPGHRPGRAGFGSGQSRPNVSMCWPAPDPTRASGWISWPEPSRRLARWPAGRPISPTQTASAAARRGGGGAGDAEEASKGQLAVALGASPSSWPPWRAGRGDAYQRRKTEMETGRPRRARKKMAATDPMAGRDRARKRAGGASMPGSGRRGSRRRRVCRLPSAGGRELEAARRP